MNAVISTAEIRLDDLSSKEIALLLQQHLDDMQSVSPPESKHALSIESLRAEDIDVWTLWQNNELAACIALKDLNNNSGEIKSMRVDNRFRGRGLGRTLVRHVIHEARSRNYKELLLETGSMDFFEPARRLYSTFGFETCGPFGSYKKDPNSTFMRLDLERSG